MVPVAIEDLSDEVKLAYIKVIVWLVHHDDGDIDASEFSELRLLMTQLSFSGELRRRTPAMMDEAPGFVLDRILERLMEEAPRGAERSIAFSLVKDMVRVSISSDGDESAESPQIAQACKYLDIDDEQLRVIRDAVEFDRQVLDGSVTSDELTATATGVAASAATVGVPLTAIYMSGSVVGLSASGVTSGLAALGVGGLLGLSSMATGIGVAALLGVGAYRGIRWAMGGNDTEKRRALRELMLQEVLRNHQKTMSGLGEDLADLAQKIVHLSRDGTENKLRVEKLGMEVTLFAEALAQVKRRGERREREARGDEAGPQDSEVDG